MDVKKWLVWFLRWDYNKNNKRLCGHPVIQTMSYGKRRVGGEKKRHDRK